MRQDRVTEEDTKNNAGNLKRGGGVKDFFEMINKYNVLVGREVALRGRRRDY